MKTDIAECIFVYPVAEVKNASSDEVAYTSFETGNKGNWTFAGTTSSPSVLPPTGKRYYDLTGSFPLAKTVINGNVYIIRLHPVNAQMTTFTYEPLIGVTSQGDINCKITYYEYDGFGRLSRIRDQDRNIIKQLCYNYAGQPVDCND